MRQSTLCYITDGARYLMLHRTKKHNDINAGKWIGVGGKIEAGETPDMCVRREVHEETGLNLKNIVFYGMILFYSDKCEEEAMYLYTSDSFTGEVTECDEGDLMWQPVTELDALPMWEGDRLFIEKIRNKEIFDKMILRYSGDILVYAECDGKEIKL